jgi:poly(A) polymerase
MRIVDVGRYEGLLRRVADVSAELNIPAYAVGGFVRDIQLGRAISEIDFVTLGAESGIRMASAVGRAVGARSVDVYPRFGTASVRLKQPWADRVELLEFVAARKESYRGDSRSPDVDTGTLEEDLLRRDFTVNAMAIRVDDDDFGRLIDLFDGAGDLERKLLRTPRPPEQTFEDDPLRMIRAVRFATELNFGIDRDAIGAIHEKAHRLSILSQERITDELQRIMLCAIPSTGYKLMHTTGLLEIFFPELTALQGVEIVGGQAHKDNFFHTLQVLDNLVEMTGHRAPEDTLWLRWAALLHDIAKPRSKRYAPGVGWTFHGHEDRGARMVPGLFRRLKLPLDERMHYVRKLVQLHHRPVALVDESVTDSAVRRLLFDAGDDIEDLMTLVRADITSKNEKRVRRYLKAFDLVEQKMVEVEEKDRLRHFQPPVDGTEIMERLGIPPGKAVGLLKDAIREAILDGTIENTHDAAFALLMEIKDEVLASAPVLRQRNAGQRGRHHDETTGDETTGGDTTGNDTTSNDE